MPEYQRVTTCHDFYVIRMFSSGEIEQARKRDSAAIWRKGEQVSCFCKWLISSGLEMRKGEVFGKSNRSRTGHFGVKNGLSKKLMKIERVVFEYLFLQVVAGEWVANILCLTK